MYLGPLSFSVQCRVICLSSIMDFKSQDYFQALVHVHHHSFCNTSVLIHFHIPCDVNVNPLLLAYLNLGFAFVFVSVFFVCLFSSH